jgi:hypothetical protein
MPHSRSSRRMRLSRKRAGNGESRASDARVRNYQRRTARRGLAVSPVRLRGSFRGSGAGYCAVPCARGRVPLARFGLCRLGCGTSCFLLVFTCSNAAMRFGEPLAQFSLAQFPSAQFPPARPPLAQFPSARFPLARPPFIPPTFVQLLLLVVVNPGLAGPALVRLVDERSLLERCTRRPLASRRPPLTGPGLLLAAAHASRPALVLCPPATTDRGRRVLDGTVFGPRGVAVPSLGTRFRPRRTALSSTGTA